MERQVIQHFLNLPGIRGLALIDGQNQPFFYGSNFTLTLPQQDSLAQRIQQVVETTPTPGETFAFRFTHQLIYLYRLNSRLILLVVMAESLALSDYRAAVEQLQQTLMANPDQAVPTCQAVAAEISPSPTVITPGLASSLEPTPEDIQEVPGNLTVDCRDLITALNHLSDGAVQYLGKTMVINTWKLSRPDQPWLKQFELEKNGHFLMPVLPQSTLTLEQQQWFRAWVSTFLERGEKTIRNFSALITDHPLSPSEKALLLGHPAKATEATQVPGASGLH